MSKEFNTQPSFYEYALEAVPLHFLKRRLTTIDLQDDLHGYSQALGMQGDFSHGEKAEPIEIPRDQQEMGFWEESQPETLYVMDQGMDGSYKVTGMIQNFQVDYNDQPVSQLLERPPVSFFDLSWSSW